MKALFLGCHCDDIELGCGGTINKHRNDWDIRCVTFCSHGYLPDGSLMDIAELSRTSLSILGVDATHSTHHTFIPDSFHEQRHDIYLAVSKLNDLKPDLVVSQAADVHEDHIVLNQIVHKIFRDCSLAEFIPSNRNDPTFGANVYEHLTDGDVAAKLASLEIYKSFYEGKAYFRPDILKSRMLLAGECVGFHYAESFRYVIRHGL